MTFFATPGLSESVNTSFTVDPIQKEIKLQRCYYLTIAAEPKTFVDTFNIGQLSPGTYTVIFYGARSSSRQNCITIKKDSIVSTFDVLDNPTGLENKANDQLMAVLYPNPITDKLNIEFTKNIDQLKIYNTLGQKVYEMLKPKAKDEIDLNFLNSGVYYLRLQNDSGQKIFKVIKE